MTETTGRYAGHIDIVVAVEVAITGQEWAENMTDDLLDKLVEAKVEECRQQLQDSTARLKDFGAGRSQSKL
jgi:hypothetical protein|tara:strand:+ start:648 stop:860 length:213 start_codon:yes stop_codon:yes gene_type:complete